ncbi:Bug family tripartite tricarboxylate transporter substrate binding protein [Nocardioides sp. NPDC057577]|uniref:Bug family tripartite tricarboxylate transporter substrate binding protein n=1 Tax=Nocardioides sp. NPDC057577 TaxID=3346171 RepID=UPI00366BD7AA
MNIRSRTQIRRAVLAATAATTVTAGLAACSPAAQKDDAAGYPSKPVEILVPAAPGGGWDQTARAIQRTIQDEDLSAKSVEVINKEGGGGATGLAQLTSRSQGDPYQLMIGGLVMIGALEQTESPLEITDANVIATLTSESEVFVVPADSPYRTIQDVVDAYTEDPASVVFGGGSAGGSDHIAIGLLLDAAGQDPADMKYVGYAGGGEATAGILSGDVEVGVSGVTEFEGQVESGKMRALAVTADDDVEVAGEPAPTLTDAGYDVDFVNWRAIFAPPEVSAAELDAVEEFVGEVHGSGAWSDVLEKNGWTDDYRSREESEKFIDEQQAATAKILEDLGL